MGNHLPFETSLVQSLQHPATVDKQHKNIYPVELRNQGKKTFYNKNDSTCEIRRHSLTKMTVPVDQTAK